MSILMKVTSVMVSTAVSNSARLRSIRRWPAVLLLILLCGCCKQPVEPVVEQIVTEAEFSDSQDVPFKSHQVPSE